MSTATAVKSTQDIADRLYELFEQGKWDVAQDELFSKDCVSIEPAGGPMPEKVQGIEALKNKSQAFNAMVEEMHGGWTSKPIVGGKYISVAMGMDCTMKGAGRMNMDEICVYEVKDGKIVSEQFFY